MMSRKFTREWRREVNYVVFIGMCIAVIVALPVGVLFIMLSTIVPRVHLASPCVMANVTMITHTAGATRAAMDGMCRVNGGHSSPLLPGNTYPMRVCVSSEYAAAQCYTQAYVDSVHGQNTQVVMQTCGLFAYMAIMFGVWTWIARFMQSQANAAAAAAADDDDVQSPMHPDLTTPTFHTGMRRV